MFALNPLLTEVDSFHCDKQDVSSIRFIFDREKNVTGITLNQTTNSLTGPN